MCGSSEVEVAALSTNGENYIILYSAKTKAQALRTLTAWAENPGLSFTWYDAALVSQKIRERGRK